MNYYEHMQKNPLYDFTFNYAIYNEKILSSWIYQDKKFLKFMLWRIRAHTKMFII